MNSDLFHRFIIKRFIPVTFVSGMFCACENDIEKVNELTSRTDLPAESARHVEMIFSDSGETKVKLNAPLLERYLGDKPYVEFKEGVNVIFYDSLMKEDSRLKADYAIQRQSENIIEGKKDVEIINQKGEKLNTEHLIWDQQQRIIYTEAFVKITTADEVIMGDGLEADQHFSKYKIKNITGVINIKEDAH